MKQKSKWILLLVLIAINLQGQWIYRNAIQIESLGTELHDVQGIVYLDQSNFNYAQSVGINGEDIRFSTSINASQFDIPHWIESWDSQGISRIWIKIPNVPTVENLNIYMFSGNASVQDASNSAATFIFYDDFDNGDWTDTWLQSRMNSSNSYSGQDYEYASISETGGLLSITDCCQNDGVCPQGAGVLISHDMFSLNNNGFTIDVTLSVTNSSPGYSQNALYLVGDSSYQDPMPGYNRKYGFGAQAYGNPDRQYITYPTENVENVYFQITNYDLGSLYNHILSYNGQDTIRMEISQAETFIGSDFSATQHTLEDSLRVMLYNNAPGSQYDKIMIYTNTVNTLPISIDWTVTIGSFQPEENSLVAYYPFNGNANDESGNSFHLSSTDPPSLIADRFGNPSAAFSFDGTSNYLHIQDTDLGISGPEVTFNFWMNSINPLVGTTREYIFSYFAVDPIPTEDNRFSFRNWDDGSPQFIVVPQDSPYSFLNLDPIASGWHMITLLYKNDLGWHVYVDGTLNTADTGFLYGFDEFIDVDYGDLELGKDLGAGSFDRYAWEGYLDDISIYDRSLDVSEIDSLYHIDGWPRSFTHADMEFDNPEGTRLLLPPNQTFIEASFTMVNHGEDNASYTLEVASADSSWLLYMDEPDPAVSYDGDIWKMRPDGSMKTQLTSGILDREPAWSPDGTQIAFQSVRGGNADIWIMNADGSGMFNLTNDPGGFNAWPSWSPDGQWVIFGSTRDYPITEIYKIDVNSGSLVRLTNNEVVDSRPKFSPDGQFFVTQTRDPDPDWSIRVYSTAGESFHQFGTPDQSDYQPGWSAMGDRVVWSSRVNGQTLDIVTARPDGSDFRIQLATRFNKFYPRFSPDGQLLAFPASLNPEEGGGEILISQPAFHSLKNVTDNTVPNSEWGPDWLSLMQSPNWVGISQTEDVLQVGESNLIQITLDMTAIPLGDHTASVIARTPGTGKIVGIYPINIRISDQYETQFISLNDVPEDQGGWLEVTWSASALDGVGQITQYGVWERNLEGAWVSLGDVPAIQRPAYSFLAHTYADMVDDVPYWSEFMITAHTQDPENYFTSEVGLGISIDNIIPEPPLNVMAELNEARQTLLSWTHSPAEDLAMYRIYRDINEEFESDPELVIGEVNNLEFLDEVGDLGTYWYRISSVDIHGNEGILSSGVNVIIVSTDSETIPETYALHQNFPNPFNPTTSIRYALPENSNVSLLIFDVRGNLIQTLESGHKAAGWYDVVWNGETADGKSISTGIYFARLVATDYSKVIKMLYLK